MPRALTENQKYVLAALVEATLRSDPPCPLTVHEIQEQVRDLTRRAGQRGFVVPDSSLRRALVTLTKRGEVEKAGITLDGCSTWRALAKIEVTSDGVTVWVNGPTGSLARFGINGIDVHSTDTAACLYCTHEKTSASDWPIFKAEVLRHHNVVVTDEHRPERFRV